MAVKLSPDSISTVSGALNAGYPDQCNQVTGEGVNENNREGKKTCPVCNREYPKRNNYCRMDGTRLEVTNAHLVENF